MEKGKLIKVYEDRLEKVKYFWGNGITNHQKEVGNEYIAHAEKSLQEVKDGRKW